jgi:hypothetical protein
LAGVLRGDFLGDADRFLAAAGAVVAAVVPIERLLERVRDPILSALATESPLLFLLFFAVGMFGKLVITSSASALAFFGVSPLPPSSTLFLLFAHSLALAMASIFFCALASLGVNTLSSPSRFCGSDDFAMVYLLLAMLCININRRFEFFVAMPRRAEIRSEWTPFSFISFHTTKIFCPLLVCKYCI